MDRSPIPGMETVVATVSGYEGTHRFDLIKLINHSGASFVGTLSPSTSHLVCWKFEGNKYKLAKRLRIPVVNHRWVEDCVKQGRRVPEHPYTLQSGQEIGPLLLEIPMVDNPGSLNKKSKVLFDKSNIFGDSDTQTVHLHQRVSDLVGLTETTLLTEDLFSDSQKGKNAWKLKRSQGKASNPKDQSASRYLAEDIPISRLLGFEHENTDSYSSVRSARGKRKTSRPKKFTIHSDMSLSSGKGKLPDNIGNISIPESSRRRQRLTKKTIGRDLLETVLLDSDDECELIRFNHENNEAAALSERVDCEIPHEIGEARVTSDASLNNNVRSRNGVFDDVEQITDWNHLPANLNACPEAAMPVTERLDTNESLKEMIKDVVQPEPITRSPVSTDLSCVICWTEFSPTRGILHCGHRFCYSCIQSWADQMTSRRKISTCPLCKASFTSITKVEGAATSDQNIYSQTIPCNLSTTDVMLSADLERDRLGAEVCCICRCREPEDLLISCHLCDIRCIHSYCLDPIMLPWTCVPCKELQMLYHRTR